jgi:hypothetical protein
MISRYVGCSIPLQFYDKIVKEACIQIIPGIFANQIGDGISGTRFFFTMLGWFSVVAAWKSTSAPQKIVPSKRPEFVWFEKSGVQIIYIID